MASHRRIPQPASPATRGLLLSHRDVLVLTICALGLLIAWLAYGASNTYGTAGAGSSPTISGSGLSAAPPFSEGPGILEPAASTPTAQASQGVEPSPTGSAQVPPGGPTVPPGTPAAPLTDGGAKAEAVFPAASHPLRITYPAAAMDVVIHPLEPDGGAAGSQSIEPPATKDGYWLTPFGTPGAGSTNTTYVVGHSWLDQDAPFNHLSWAATPGDELTVFTATGVMTYTVDSVATYSKSTLKDSPIWAIVPNRLVLVSCYSEDPWGRNVTVIASPVRGP